MLAYHKDPAIKSAILMQLQAHHARTPEEFWDAAHGPGAWEIQAARASECSCWQSALGLIRAARDWRRMGEPERAQRCFEDARISRGNALMYRRLAKDARARSDEWAQKFVARAEVRRAA